MQHIKLNITSFQAGAYNCDIRHLHKRVPSMACWRALTRPPYKSFAMILVLPQSSVPKCGCIFNTYHAAAVLAIMALHAGMMECEEQMTTCVV